MKQTIVNSKIAHVFALLALFLSIFNANFAIKHWIIVEIAKIA